MRIKPEILSLVSVEQSEVESGAHYPQIKHRITEHYGAWVSHKLVLAGVLHPTTKSCGGSNAIHNLQKDVRHFSWVEVWPKWPDQWFDCKYIKVEAPQLSLVLQRLSSPADCDFWLREMADLVPERGLVSSTVQGTGD